MDERPTTRRALLARGAAVLGAVALGGCESVADNPVARKVLDGVGGLNRRSRKQSWPRSNSRRNTR